MMRKLGVFQRSWISLVREQRMVPGKGKGHVKWFVPKHGPPVRAGAEREKRGSTYTPIGRTEHMHQDWGCLPLSSAPAPARRGRRHAGERRKEMLWMKDPDTRPQRPPVPHYQQSGPGQGQALAAGLAQIILSTEAASLNPSGCTREVTHWCFSPPSSMKINKNTPSGKDWKKKKDIITEPYSRGSGRCNQTREFVKICKVGNE